MNIKCLFLVAVYSNPTIMRPFCPFLCPSPNFIATTHFCHIAKRRRPFLSHLKQILTRESISILSSVFDKPNSIVQENSQHYFALWLQKVSEEEPLMGNNESTICIENVPQWSRRSKNWTRVSVKPGELLRYWVAAMDILIKMISKVRNVSALGGARSLFASPLTSQAASWLDLDNF